MFLGIRKGVCRQMPADTFETREKDSSTTGGKQPEFVCIRMKRTFYAECKLNKGRAALSEAADLTMSLNIRLLLLCFVAGSNCLGSDITAPARTGKQALIAHVRFLADPALKGRKPKTAGSRAARRYIEARFKECGLVPWRDAKGYELPFGYGINVVGVLPGLDPNLKEQLVIVSAHYDHLGKTQGKIYAGAGDNASGVGAMLEVAREMASSAERPRRSVAFVAFDCEEMMLLGSFAFSCRPDVEHAKIAAVVNMDMLGRNLLDVVRQTIFIAGTEQYPQLRERVRGFGTNAGIRVLPLGTDLVGPRSDHATPEGRREGGSRPRRGGDRVHHGEIEKRGTLHRLLIELPKSHRSTRRRALASCLAAN